MSHGELRSPALAPEEMRKNGARCIFSDDTLSVRSLLRADGDLKRAGSVSIQVVDAGRERQVCLR